MMKTNVLMILCLLLTTPFIGGDLGNERTNDEAVIADAHSMYRKSISASKKAKIVTKLQEEIELRRQRLLIEGDISHMPATQWSDERAKLMSTLPLDIASYQGMQSGMAHYVRKILRNSGLSKNATKKIVKHWFPSHGRVKRQARELGITKREYEDELLVRQKVLHSYLSAIAIAPRIKNLGEYIAKTESIYETAISKLSNLGGYDPEAILKAEAVYTARLNELEESAYTRWSQEFDTESTNQYRERMWTFATTLFSKQWMQEHIPSVFKEQKASDNFAIETNISKDRTPSVETNFDDVKLVLLTAESHKIKVTKAKTDKLLKNIPSLKPTSVSQWIGQDAKSALQQALTAALKQTAPLERAHEALWTKEHKPKLDKKLEAATSKWNLYKKNHDESEAYHTFLEIQRYERKLENLDKTKSLMVTDVDIQAYIDEAPWTSTQRSTVLLKGMFLEAALTSSTELSLFHNPAFIPEYVTWGPAVENESHEDRKAREVCNITPQSLSASAGERLATGDSPYITLKRKFGFNEPNGQKGRPQKTSDDYADIKEWTIKHGLPTRMHYQEMTAEQLHAQHMETPIMLSLPERYLNENGEDVEFNVLETLGLHFNSKWKEGEHFESLWTGKFYDFFAPTPKQVEKKEIAEIGEALEQQFAF
jgi:hypothetical protein